MNSRAAKLQTLRSRNRQIPAKPSSELCLPSSAGKKRTLSDVTNQHGVKHPAYRSGKSLLEAEAVLADLSNLSSSGASEMQESLSILGGLDDNDLMATSPSLSHLDMSINEPIVDIDLMEDPSVSCSEYTQDIFAYLRDAETRFRPNPDYMKKQPDISSNMRSILMEWLVEVVDEYKLEPQTLYLAVTYVDRFLSRMSVTRSKLQLLGTAAIYLAAKLEEIYPPELKDFVYITDDTYTKKQVVKMEQVVLHCLQFNLISPTIHTFLVRFLKAVNADNIADKLAHYLCELSLLSDVPFLKHQPSAIAASSTCIALHTLGHNAWPATLAHYSQYSMADVRDCIQDLHTVFCQASNSPRQAIRDRYKAEKYCQVSLLKPPSTLPF